MRKDHPLRPIRAMVDEILKQLSPQFQKMYAKVGRRGHSAEQLLRARYCRCCIRCAVSVLMEEMDYNILFRWFVGLNSDDPGGTRRCSRTATGCWRPRWPRNCWRGWWGSAAKGWACRQRFGVDGALLERGPAHEEFPNPRTERVRPPPDDPGNPRWTSRRAALKTRRTNRKPIPTRSGAQSRGQGGQVELQRKSRPGQSQRIDRVEHGVGSHGHSWSAMRRWPCCSRFPGTGRVTVGGDKGFDTAELSRMPKHGRHAAHVAQTSARRGAAGVSIGAPRNRRAIASVRRNGSTSKNVLAG